MNFVRLAFLLDKYGVRLSMDQLADAMGLATNTIYNKVASGKLRVPTYLDDGKRWADAVAVASYLDEMAKSATIQA